MLINNKSDSIIRSFIDRPSSSVIVEGREDYGVTEVLERISRELLGNRYAGNKIQVTCGEDKSIGIEVIRELKKKLSTIAGKDQRVTRVAFIHEAEKLTLEAQNALLKLIEEPVSNSLLVLQVTDRSLLLQTIVSRCQIIPILPISKMAALSHAKKHGVTEAEAKKAYALSSGGSKLFQEIITRQDSSTLQRIQLAKEFLTSNVYVRLANSKKYETGDEIHLLVTSLQTVARAGLHAANQKTTKRWQRISTELQTISQLLKVNTNVKLVYIRLCVVV